MDVGDVIKTGGLDNDEQVELVANLIKNSN